MSSAGDLQDNSLGQGVGELCELTGVIVKGNVVFRRGPHSLGVGWAGQVGGCHGGTGQSQAVVGVA